MDFHDHENIHKQRNQILILLCVIVLYIGIQFGLSAANFVSQETIEAKYTIPFHLLEFWAVFSFTLLQSFILIATGVVTWTDAINRVQFILLIINIISTLIAAILVSLSLEMYEVPAHYLEYSIQILISLIDFIFIFNTKEKAPPQEETEDEKAQKKGCFIFKIIFAICSVITAILILIIYADGFSTGIEPERAAHFGEYLNEILNACFLFWFSLVKYNELNDEQDQNENRLRRKTHHEDEERQKLAEKEEVIAVN